jgi:hypothetical protein
MTMRPSPLLALNLRRRLFVLVHLVGVDDAEHLLAFPELLHAGD